MDKLGPPDSAKLQIPAIPSSTAEKQGILKIEYFGNWTIFRES